MGLLSGRDCARRLLCLFVGIALVGSGLFGCERTEGGPGRYAAHGTIEDVDLENGQVLIDHDDVDGLMPAMTMNFAVPDRALLARMAPGQVVDFTIHFTGHGYDVVESEVVGEASESEGWFRLREGLVRTSPAPPFDLTDQAGRRVGLASLADRVLVVDFIYTSCPGPCPVQTSIGVALQRRIPESLHDHVQFVSISLDPETDRPEVLERYAAARGVDFSNWSFLTGPTNEVARVVQEWGIGSLRKEDGSIDHTLIRFLVKDGRIFERYWTAEADNEALLSDVIALAKERALESADGVADGD